MGDKGGLIEIKLRELSAGTVRAYLYTLQGFLKWFKAQPEWLQEVDLSSDRVGTIIAKAGQNVNAMGKTVNKERVERETDTLALDPKQLKMAMVGSYLKANDRHERFRDLLERKTVNIETLTREDFTNVRDNLILLLTIRNIRRAGDVPHLKLRLIEAVTMPEGQDMVDLGVAEHKTMMSGKPSPVTVTAGELQQLKYMACQTRARAAKLQLPEPKYVFTNVRTGKLESSTTMKALTADWDRHFKELFGDSKNHV